MKEVLALGQYGFNGFEKGENRKSPLGDIGGKQSWDGTRSNDFGRYLVELETKIF